ncbi:YdbL family protein [Catenovulum sp. SM1970]|uniref:YdbL family protein n=1 Tax=Marinifaba aquimaris TaxID=2741323 RepID=UPI001573871D|nr:YdbL family protein [Marinifaba aquimaris]NTS77260.1 YdbL family protein [Marinifaba aquimaris]
MKKTAKLLTLFSALCLSFSALALDIATAKSAGLVGETANGYLALVKEDSKAAQLIKEINAKRKATYQQLAKKNQLTLQQIEQMAGKKAQSKTSAGNFIQVNGKWQKK